MSATLLPAKYKWLADLKGPLMIVEALKLYGTKEIVGKQHNPVILGWAKEVEIDHIYRDDETPWCGLAMAVVAKRAKKSVPLTGYDILRALQWAKFGVKVPVAMLGDILVFRRDGGGHVGLYVGEDKDYYHVLGGNQKNAFNIIRIEKHRIHAIRRPRYNVQPAEVKQIFLSADGAISKNEA